jgi:hypothetical protein
MKKIIIISFSRELNGGVTLKGENTIEMGRDDDRPG